MEWSRRFSVFFYVPNVIGYLRICLVALSVCFSSYYSFLPTVILYTCSQFLDAVDGWIARRLDQATLFGAVLDQLTDRMSTLCLYILNIAAHPSYITGILLLCVIDMSGHWIHTLSSALCGKPSHKAITDGNFLLRFYYQQPSVMFLTHGSYELFWLSLFVISRDVPPSAIYVLMVATPLMLFKCYTNIAQCIHGARILAARDQPSRHQRTTTQLK
eukprot:GHVS01094545.1.p1 GENE.GHVS01094545.1~~GHVS01094545.1.p1  ORF type:complete len:216 (+),score=11.83 GHVS01094545.1:154-801(+)